METLTRRLEERGLAWGAQLFCLLGFGVLALAYLGLLEAKPYALDLVVKAAPIYCLIGLTCCTWRLSGTGWVVAALLFSSMGDVLLALSWQHAFAAGLGAFLCAQLIYACLFYRLAVAAMNLNGPIIERENALWRRVSSGRRRYLLAALLGYYLLALAVLLPRVGELALAVWIYISAITAMVLMAGFYTAAGQFGGRWVLAGALSFLVSDSVIALDKFLLAFEWAEAIIMSTYYVAQLSIVLGLLSALRRGKLPD